MDSKTIDSILKILIVEDNPGDARLIKETLKDVNGTSFDLDHVDRLSHGLERLVKGGIDLILLDLSLPDSHGLETYERFRAAAEGLPIVVLTGLDNEEISMEAIALGAQDYLVKTHMDSHSLSRSIRYSIERQSLMEELKKSNQKILEQQKSVIEEEQLKVLLQLSGATAHELNQPLTGLMGSIDLIRIDKDKPENMLIYIDDIEESAKRISSIVKKIQNIRYDSTKPYVGETSIIDIDQKINLLSVEDSDNDFKTLKNYLKTCDNIALKRAASIEESINLLKPGDFDLILLDFRLPDGDAFNLLNKMESEAIEVPAVVITGQGDEIIASQTIQAGAFDYLPKDKMTAQSLSRTIMNTLEKAQLKRQVKEAYNRMAEMSTRDDLTGLYNRRYFIEALEQETARAQRYKTDLVLCMIDLDRFKKINDSYGHPAGDVILSEIGEMLSGAIRENDIACRYGGEEFAVILSHTNIEEAFVMSERFRQGVASHRFEYNSTCMQITVSIGIAQYKNSEEISKKQILEIADMALYKAKEKGRNRVVAL